MSKRTCTSHSRESSHSSSTHYESERNDVDDMNRFYVALGVVVAYMSSTLDGDELSTKRRRYKFVRTQLNTEISFTTFAFE